MTEYELDVIFAQLDEDGSGLLSFDEFRICSIQASQYLDESEKIWIAYNHIKRDDKDHLTMEEVKAVFSPEKSITVETWRFLLDLQVDDDFNPS